MSSLSSSIECITLLLSLLCFMVVQNSETETENTRIKLSIPVNPVEGGMLSLHCQIWNFNSKDEVMIARTIGDVRESLSWNNQVRDDDDRMFIAVRQMPDSSVVYFLTLIDIAADDTGNYSCKVITTAGRTADVAADETEVKVRYFPSENSLSCAPTGGVIVTEGHPVTVNCSSKSTGYPFVSLDWTRAGSSRISHTPQVVTADDQVLSQLYFTPTLKDHGAVLLCMMKSEAFLDQDQSCHIGPLDVRSLDGADSPPGISDRNVHAVTISEGASATERTNQNTEVDRNTRPIPKRCSDVCASQSSKVWYWIVATVATGVIALICFIVVLTLFLKIVFSKPSSTVNKLPLPGLYSEDIYVDLERRRGGEKVYMALEKHDIIDDM